VETSQGEEMEGESRRNKTFQTSYTSAIKKIVKRIFSCWPNVEIVQVQITVEHKNRNVFCVALIHYTMNHSQTGPN